MATNGLLVLFEHCLCREHRNFPPCNSPMQFYYCSMVQQETIFTIDASGMWVNTWNWVFLLNIYIYVWTENQNNSSMQPKMDIQSLHFVHRSFMSTRFHTWSESSTNISLCTCKPLLRFIFVRFTSHISCFQHSTNITSHILPLHMKSWGHAWAVINRSPIWFEEVKVYDLCTI